MAISSPEKLNGATNEADAASVPTALATRRPHGAGRRRAFVPRPVDSQLKTGHSVVDAIGSIQLQGIIIDWNWLHHPAFQNDEGKPNLTTILVYADLVDWYRPYKKRDPGNYDAVYYLRKFDDEFLVKTYKRWANDLGISKRQVEEAVAALCKAGLAQKRQACDEVRRKWTSKIGNEKPLEIWPIPAKVREVSGREQEPPYALAPSLRTGSAICDEMLQIELRGDVLDFNWLIHPKMRRGTKNKLNITALFTFSNLFFLFTPTRPIDEKSHKPKPWKTKFEGEAVVKSYDYWADATGLHSRQLKDAVAFLVEQGLVKRWVDTIDLGDMESNLLAFMLLDADAVKDLTFGPAPENERAALAAKLPTKKGAVAAASHLAPPQTAPEKTDNPRQKSLFAETGPEKTDNLPTKKRTTSLRKNGLFIEPPLGALNSQQQQQAPNGQNVSVGVGLDAFASGENETRTPDESIEVVETEIAQRQRACVERLHALGTGLDFAVIRRAVSERLEHCETWAEHWSTQPEADPLFWVGRERGSCAGALRRRIENVGQVPPELVREQINALRRQEAAEKREREQLARALEDREQRQANAYQRKVAASVLHRFSMQPPELQRAAIARAASLNDFLVGRSPGRDLTRLVERALDGKMDGDGLLFTLTSELSGALDQVSAERPALPGMTQLAAGEDEWDEGFDDYGAEEPGIIAPGGSLLDQIRAGAPLLIISELTRDVRDGQLAVADLDEHRSNLYQLDEWEAIKTRVIAEITPPEEL